MSNTQTEKLERAVGTLSTPLTSNGDDNIASDLYVRGLVLASLTKHFGTYSGDWTEPSIRTAGNTLDPETSKRLEESLNKAHPANTMGGALFQSRPRRDQGGDIYGHWMLPSGTLTGQLHDHAQSAEQVLGALPGYKPKVDPIFDLMSLSGVIRVRYAKDKHLVVDIVRKPSREQLQKLVDLAGSVEGKGGSFMFSVLTPGDTGTLAEGMSSDDLLDVDWRRVPAN